MTGVQFSCSSHIMQFTDTVSFTKHRAVYWSSSVSLVLLLFKSSPLPRSTHERTVSNEISQLYPQHTYLLTFFESINQPNYPLNYPPVCASRGHSLPTQPHTCGYIRIFLYTNRLLTYSLVHPHSYI